jgi:hypothetical protein
MDQLAERSESGTASARAAENEQGRLLVAAPIADGRVLHLQSRPRATGFSDSRPRARDSLLPKRADRASARPHCPHGVMELMGDKGFCLDTTQMPVKTGFRQELRVPDLSTRRFAMRSKENKVEIRSVQAEGRHMQGGATIHESITGKQRLFIALLLTLSTLLSFVVVRLINPDDAFRRSVAPPAVSAPQPRASTMPGSEGQ